MVTDQQFWLVVHEMFARTTPGNWFPGAVG